MGQPHDPTIGRPARPRPRRADRDETGGTARSLGAVEPFAVPALDPTGGTLGAVVALLGLVAALVVLLRWWFQNRGR